MSFFGGSSGGGQHRVDVGELRVFQQALREYQSQLDSLDRKLKQSLDRLAGTYTDPTYQRFREHADAQLLKHHKVELERVGRMISHFDKLIQHYSETDRIRNQLGNL